MLKIYNTMSGKKEEFKPVKEGEVGMYVCGPTVYGLIHVGNARTFMTFDVLHRYLEQKGYKVKYVQNITDVGHLTDVGEDKIMKGAAERGMEPLQFVKTMMEEYFEDLRMLNINPSDIFAKATDHIQDMIEVIQRLIEKGYAYVSEGYVYYDISKFKNYGRLSGQNPEELMKLRTEPHPNKRNLGDFALWIPAPANYPMKWNSPWGKGFPGWHIECSTMSSKYLGLPFDIHGGGKDLTFPHHEDEIAQAEAASGRNFVNYWMHSEFILFDGRKMSKSLKNVTVAREAAKTYGAKALRYFLLSSHYRSEINLTKDSIDGAKKTVDNLLDFMERMREANGSGKHNEGLSKAVKEARDGWESALDDDLNMPKALTSVFSLVTEANKALDSGELDNHNKKEVLDAMEGFDMVLGVLERKFEAIPEEVKQLAEEREKARKKKDWKKADELRKDIHHKGWIVEDKPDGYRLRKE